MSSPPNTDCGSSGHGRWRSTATLHSPMARRSKCCDVYVGFSGQKPCLLRFVNWLHAELVLQGVSCLASDRRRCPDACSHGKARIAMDAATVGVVVITKETFSNPYGAEEIRLFLERKNLLPVFFDRGTGNAERGGRRRGEEGRKVVDGLSHLDYRLETNAGNWRDCISQAVDYVGVRLGRRSIVERVKRWKWSEKEEHPFPRNMSFVGRRKELRELELRLFGYVAEEDSGDRPRMDPITTSTGAGHRRKQHGHREGKGKEPLLPRRSEDEEEVDDTFNRRIFYVSEHDKSRRSSVDKRYGKGFAVVSGNAGVGKTELLLEFSYRYSQRYKKVLWVGGEARQLWQSYVSLLRSLEVDVGLENEVSRLGSFEELENQAITRVRKELARGIPFLVVIDGLETDKDWWNGYNIERLLPEFGGDTHILISTRLPALLDFDTLRLPRLSPPEAMSLMRGSLADLPPDESNALRVIGERLRGLTFGLSAVGAILAELQMSPRKLLRSIDKIPHREPTRGGEEEDRDHVLRRNPFLVRLLDFCLLVFDLADKTTKLASSMVEAGGWFAPSPVPVSVLALAATDVSRQRNTQKSWNWLRGRIACFGAPNSRDDRASTAASMLCRLRLVKGCTKAGLVRFHDIVRLYAREMGSPCSSSSPAAAPHAMVHAVNAKGCLPHHSNHVWESCFLLFRFGPNPATVHLKPSDLVSFTKRLVLPLALMVFTDLRHCTAAVELLRQSSETLEVLDDSYLSGAQTATPCCLSMGNDKSSADLDPCVYREFALVRATLLETRAALMRRGGFHDIGDQLHGCAASIEEVVVGSKHPSRRHGKTCNTGR